MLWQRSSLPIKNQHCQLLRGSAQWGGPWFVGFLYFFSRFIFTSSWLPHLTCETHTSKIARSKLHIEKLWFVRRNNLASVLIKLYPTHLYRQHPNVWFCISIHVSCPHWVALKCYGRRVCSEEHRSHGLTDCYITILIFQPLFSSGNLLVYKNIFLFTKHLTLYLVGEKVTLYFLVESKCVCFLIVSLVYEEVTLDCLGGLQVYWFVC